MVTSLNLPLVVLIYISVLHLKRVVNEVNFSLQYIVLRKFLGQFPNRSSLGLQLNNYYPFLYSTITKDFDSSSKHKLSNLKSPTENSDVTIVIQTESPCWIRLRFVSHSPTWIGLTKQVPVHQLQSCINPSMTLLMVYLIFTLSIIQYCSSLNYITCYQNQ